MRHLPKFALFWILVLAGFGLALPMQSKGYEPLPNLPRAKSQPCSVTQINHLADIRCKAAHLIERPTQDGFIAITNWRGEILRQATLTDWFGPVKAAYQLDLNNDGLADFLVVLADGTNGQTKHNLGIFFLSTTSGYFVIRMLTTGLDANDLLLYKNHSLVVHTWLVRDSKTKSNYWVHHFYEFHGNTFAESLALTSQWILYSSKPNHTNSLRLSEQQKNKLWQQQVPRIFYP